MEDVLLKSGLPLEHVVAKKLADKAFNVLGTYSYAKYSEAGIEKEFSIDFVTVEALKRGNKLWGSLNLLVECMRFLAETQQRAWNKYHCLGNQEKPSLCHY